MVALIAFGTSMFRFPSAALQDYSAAAVDMQCTYVPFGVDNATLAAARNGTAEEQAFDVFAVAGRLLTFVSSPVRLNAPSFCQEQLLGLLADQRSLAPAVPVLHVVDGMERGVAGAQVTAQVHVLARTRTAAGGAADEWEALDPPEMLDGFPKTLRTTPGGYAALAGAQLGPPRGLALRITLSTTVDGAEASVSLNAYRASPARHLTEGNAVFATVGAVDGVETGAQPSLGPGAVAVRTGQRVRVDVLVLRPGDGSQPAAHTPVVLSVPDYEALHLEGYLGPDDVLMRGAPDMQVTGADGRASFEVEVETATLGSGLVPLLVNADAALNPLFGFVSDPPYPSTGIVLNLSAAVRRVELREDRMPPRVLRVGSTDYPTVNPGETSYFGIVSAPNSTAPPVVCVTPPIPDKRVFLKAIAVDMEAEVSEAALGDAEAEEAAAREILGEEFYAPEDKVDGEWPIHAPLPPRMVAPRMFPDAAVTGADGCATFDGFRFVDGSSGTYALEFSADDAAVLSLSYMVVNRDLPEYSSMEFLGGGGAFVRLLGAFALPLAVLLCCGNRGHTLVGRVCGLTAHALWLAFIVWLSFDAPGGVFIVGRAFLNSEQPAVFLENCCTFEGTSSTANAFSLALLFISVAMTANAAMLVVQSGVESVWGMRCSKRRREPFIRAHELLLGYGVSADRAKVRRYYRVVKRLLGAPASRAQQSAQALRADLRSALEASTVYARTKSGRGLRARVLAVSAASAALVRATAKFLFAIFVLWWYYPAVYREPWRRVCPAVGGAVAGLPRALAAWLLRLLRLLAWLLPTSEEPEAADPALSPARRKEARLAFHYPLRLYATCISSLFLTGVLALFIGVSFGWASFYAFEALHEYWSLREQALPHMFLPGVEEPAPNVVIVLWPPSASRYSVLSRLVFGVSGLALDALYTLLEADTYELVFRDIVPPAVGGIAFLCWLGMALAWWSIFSVYRGQVLRARAGQWPFDKRAVLVSNAPKYLPYQLSNALVGYLGLFFCTFWVVLIIVLVIFIAPLWELVTGALLDALSPPNGVLLHAMVIVLIATTAREMLVRRQGQIIRNYAFFAIFDFVTTVSFVVVGVLAVLKRLAVLVAGVVVSFWRLDKRWLAKISIDSGHHAYCAMLMADLMHNNPIVVVFCDVLMREMNARRAAVGDGPVTAEEYMPCPLPCCCCCCCVPACRCCYDTKRGEGMCSSSQPGCLNRRHLRARAGVSAAEAALLLPPAARPAPALEWGDAERPKGAAETAAAARRRRQRIVNKWWLLLVLERNPSVRRHRRHRQPRALAARSLMRAADHHGRVRQTITACSVRTSVQPRYCVVTEGYLVLYRSVRDLKPLGTVNLADVTPLDQTPLVGTQLPLVTPFGSIFLDFPSPAQRNAWRTSCIAAQRAALQEAEAARAAADDTDSDSGDDRRSDPLGAQRGDAAARRRAANANRAPASELDRSARVRTAARSPARRSRAGEAGAGHSSFFMASSSHATAAAPHAAARLSLPVARAHGGGALRRRGSDADAADVPGDVALASSRERGEAERQRVLAKAGGARRGTVPRAAHTAT